VVAEFVRRTRIFGLETTASRYYAVYRGEVTSTADPEMRGRVQVLIPGAGQQRPLTVWVDPAFLGASQGRGLFWPPEMGDLVRVGFENGDVDNPSIWLGGWHTRNALPAEFAYDTTQRGSPVPRRRGFVTRGGHALLFDDTVGGERVSLTWHASDPGDAYRTDPKKSADRATGKTSKIAFDPDGSFQLSVFGGYKVRVDVTAETVLIEHPGGTKVSLSRGKVEVTSPQAVKLTAPTVEVAASSVILGNGGNHPVPRGDSLVQWLATHTHPTGTPNTGPPTIPPTPSLLSPGVKVP